MQRFNRIIFGIIVVSFIIFWSISSKYLELLWFKSLGSTTVFWVTLITGPLAKLLIGIVIMLFLTVNLLIALKAFNRIQVSEDGLFGDLSAQTLFWPGLVVAGFLSFILATGFSLDWTVIQQFYHQVKTGITDPVFHQDLGFYLFSFPFLQQLNGLFQAATFIGLAGTALIYLVAKAFHRQGRSWELWLPAKLHLTILAILFLVTKIFGYQLGKFALLLKDTARMTGINYTAAHAKILALAILTWIVVAIIVLLVISLFRKGSNILLGGLAVWLASSFILLALYPGFVQSFIVAPDEYTLEEPYLKNHIALTRQAYGLDKIKQRPFVPRETKAVQLNMANPALADLRLWDYKPLMPSYNQLQSIRPYYQFNDIDIDRYPSANGQRQTMLAAREFNPDRLAAQAHTWINLHLTYTHGYGFAANQVNQFTSQGQPIFTARDLPPKSDPNFPAFKLDQPGIYFGELTNNYIIVNTKSNEFDYPKGEGNITTRYQGNNGILLDSFLKKFLMAIHFMESNFLISPQLTNESRLLMNRNINDRVRKLAPFLKYDNDPYLVVSEGKLFWIIDAYTSSAYYPYAKYHESGVNYLRNSVKVVVDAYNGNVDFYVLDPNDPIIKVWQRIFPHLFKPAQAVPSDLNKHFRYPQHLMEVQRDLLLQYHMTDSKTFYEQEDYWQVPTENQEEIFEPIYATLKLPEEQSPEFSLMQPFAPRGKQNLISWLIARSDLPNYGELILYTLPKDQNIYGPAQIDSRINQDQTISQLITLWNQQRSKVIWGKLLIIPIEGSILYLKPLMIESETGQQAELKKVVLVYENQVLLGDTVADALSRFNNNQPDLNLNTGKPTKTPINRRADIIKRLEEILKEQQRLYEELRKY